MATTYPTALPPRRRSISLGQSLMHIFLFVWCVIAVAPFIWSFLASFKPFRELVSSQDLFPHTWTLNGYREIFNRAHFLTAVRNSIISAVSVTVATCFTSAAVGYVFAKYRFWGKEQLFTLLLATLMVPFAVVLVPLYITIYKIGLGNSLGGIIVTGFWSTFGIFLMRQFMETIPFELIDAARIDGASEWRIFFRIVLPLATAPLAALAIFSFLGNWDSYLWPLVVLNSPEKQTIPLILSGLRSLYWTRYDMWTAGSMLTVVPIMILYAFASKWFIRGIAMTGIKG
ncbi:MAG: carbohydrate ABC transporter permease [Herpetosiphonaceae bacterium]|nr:carbohydrate ABC transporter permease [Herpetosiphonaceae bacterium]